MEKSLYKQVKKEIKEREDCKKRPLKYYKGLKNFTTYIFISKSKLSDAFDTLINKEKI